MTSSRRSVVPALPGGDASRLRQQRKKKAYKVTFEQVTQEKKKFLIRSVKASEQPPQGYTLVPIGHTPDLTERCLELCRTGGKLIYSVEAPKSRKVNNSVSAQIYRYGHFFPSRIVDDAARFLGYIWDPQKGRWRHGRLAADFRQELEKHLDAHKEKDDVEQISAAIRELFPNIPDSSIQPIINRSFAGDSKRVGHAQNLSLAERVGLAVGAHVRHEHSDYDKLLDIFDWKRCREMIESTVTEKLKLWRGEVHDDLPPEQEEVFREVIVIDDDSDDNSADDVDSDLVSEFTTSAEGEADASLDRESSRPVLRPEHHGMNRSSHHASNTLPGRVALLSTHDSHHSPLSHRPLSQSTSDLYYATPRNTSSAVHAHMQSPRTHASSFLPEREQIVRYDDSRLERRFVNSDYYPSLYTDELQRELHRPSDYQPSPNSRPSTRLVYETVTDHSPTVYRHESHDRTDGIQSLAQRPREHQTMKPSGKDDHTYFLSRHSYPNRLQPPLTVSSNGAVLRRSRSPERGEHLVERDSPRYRQLRRGTEYKPEDVPLPSVEAGVVGSANPTSITQNSPGTSGSRIDPGNHRRSHDYSLFQDAQNINSTVTDPNRAGISKRKSWPFHREDVSIEQSSSQKRSRLNAVTEYSAHEHPYRIEHEQAGGVPVSDSVRRISSSRRGTYVDVIDLTSSPRKRQEVQPNDVYMSHRPDPYELSQGQPWRQQHPAHQPYVLVETATRSDGRGRPISHPYYGIRAANPPTQAPHPTAPGSYYANGK